MIYLYSPTQPGKLVFEKGDNAPSRGPILPLATEKALEVLKKDTNGFFMMVEGSQIDWGGHANEMQYVLTEFKEFNTTIARVLEYAKADGNTLVIVTADHETGGLALTGGNLKKSLARGSFNTEGHTATMVPVFSYGPTAKAFSGIYENTAIFDKMLETLTK